MHELYFYARLLVTGGIILSIIPMLIGLAFGRYFITLVCHSTEEMPAILGSKRRGGGVRAIQQILEMLRLLGIIKYY